MLDVLRKGERAHTREFKREPKRDCQARGRTSHVHVQMWIGTWDSGLSSFLVKILSLKKFVGKVLFGGA